MCCCTTGGNERPHTEAAARRRIRRRTGSEGGDTDTSQPTRKQSNKQYADNEQGRFATCIACLCRKNAEIPTMVFFAVIGSVRLRLRIADGHHGKYLLPNRYRTIAHYNKTTSTYCTVTGLVCNKTFSWLKEGRRARERKRTRSTRPLARRRRGKYRYRYCITCRDIYR